MRRLTILASVLSLLWSPNAGEGHSYIFSKEYEEMRDQVWIYVMAEQITIQYESKYYGQIAPHIRNMIDVNADTVLTEQEVENFFAEYERLLADSLRQFPLFVDGRPVTMEVVDVVAPSILEDSLLAPFRVRMVFQVDDFSLGGGEHSLEIDPKTLFLSSSQFIRMARERVAFTDQQEKAVGRYLQINVFGTGEIEFTEAYPGYIRKEHQVVRVYGVFYDETVLRMKDPLYPNLRIRFIRHQANE